MTEPDDEPGNIAAPELGVGGEDEALPNGDAEIDSESDEDDDDPDPDDDPEEIDPDEDDEADA